MLINDILISQRVWKVLSAQAFVYGQTDVCQADFYIPNIDSTQLK